MTELEELKLAYAECNRQRNELLHKHKLQALAPVDAPMCAKHPRYSTYPLCPDCEYEKEAQRRAPVDAEPTNNIEMITPEGPFPLAMHSTDTINGRLVGRDDLVIVQSHPTPLRELSDGEIYTAYIEAANQTLRPQDERIALAFARAVLKAAR